MNADYEFVIEANKNWFAFDWKGLLHYRDLLFLLVRRDFVSKYKQTILGPLWFVLQPLLMTLVFSFVFGNIVKISTEKVPPLLFYLCGLLVWNYFAQNLNATSQSLVANTHIFSKVYFPRLIIPLSAVISNLLTFLLQLVMFLGFFIYFRYFTQAKMDIHPNLFILVLPLLVFQTAVISLGVGLWISALTVKYRDFQYLTTFLTQLWMYATPVIYPISAVPEKWRMWIVLNPMSAIVEFYRYAFFGIGAINSCYLFISVMVSIFLFFSGIFIFNKVQRTFVDII